MRRSPHKHTIRDRWRVNRKLLIIKAMALAVKASPFKIPLIKAFAALRCINRIPRIIKKRRRRETLLKFARHIGDQTPDWLYVSKYFFRNEYDRLLDVLFFEVPALKHYIAVEGSGLLTDAIKEDRGVVLVGAHYGPRLLIGMLNEMGIHPKWLRNNTLHEQIEYMRKLALPGLLTKDITSFDPEYSLPARRSEKEFVRHLKNKGVVVMLIDSPSKDENGEMVKYFGVEARLHSFPFKLALKYNAPVLFYCFEKTDNGGYRLHFTRLMSFSTPKEGVEKYSALVQHLVKKYPYMWMYGDAFLRLLP